MSPEEQIDAIVLAVLDEVGAEMESDIQEVLEVAYPPSSTPGEAPHRRTGNLANLISYTVGQFGTLYILNVLSEAHYSAALEFGLDRPFMLPALEKWTPILIDRLQEALGGASGAAPPVNSSAGMIYPSADAA
jgi:hypothetical protein